MKFFTSLISGGLDKWIYFSEHLQLIMFGDLFSQRGDYSDGLFYGGHRKFLNGRGTSILEPPNEFKSKRAYRNMKRLEKNESTDSVEKINFHINFQKKHEPVEEQVDHNVKKFKKLANAVKQTVILEHFSSISRLDWVEDVQAGCHIWINKNTGEVVSVCPWAVHDDSGLNTPDGETVNDSLTANSSVHSRHVPPFQSGSVASKSTLQSAGSASINSKSYHNHFLDERDDSVEYGTGSLVYDSSELETLFAMLDSASSKK